MTKSYRLTFITPLFSKGSYEDVPEIRPPSIRGQLHWWFRAIGGSYQDEKALFGAVHGGAQASKLAVRVNHITGQPGSMATLPHKSGGQASSKACFKPGASCDLHLSLRHLPLDDRLAKQLDRCVEAWLLLGTLGLRSTRGAGSFRFEPLTEPHSGLTPPSSLAEFRQRCGDLLQGAPLRFGISPTPFTKAEDARRIISDTLGGRDDYRGEDDLARSIIRWGMSMAVGKPHRCACASWRLKEPVISQRYGTIVLP
ncbi:type III-B CRISPR module RAMP protein Cmr1 [Verrucomicrobium spinosum]|uniref:type III-B CRISPR module RAMP protein Cmr1 n=1 Tax=Verrucomicrobium spinosum TaxID=2736 RepID=UPI000946636D|nr:type III-B CRISPR module RAMP protein Cmr1 [Verrucomicrobium spinosum]